MNDTLEKVSLIHLLRQKESRQQELRDLRQIIQRLHHIGGDRENIIELIDKELDSSIIVEAPQYLNCNISFVAIPFLT